MASFFESLFGGGDKKDTTVDQPKGGRGSEGLYSKPKNSALDDLQMDLGLKPKNDVYYRDLAERSAKSQAAMEAMMNSSDDGPSRAATEEKPAEEEETVETVTPTTSVETISQSIDELIAELMAGRQGEFDPSFVSGPSEEEAMEYAEKGRKSTIKTSAQGIVDAPRQRRSLLAGS